jgi:hypothetical protein
MQRFVFLITVVISSLASLFSLAENTRACFADFSFGAVNTRISGIGLAPTTSPKTCSELNGLHLSVADNFTDHFRVVADFSTCFDNRVNPFGPTAGEIKFSLYTFSGRPQFRFPEMSRFTPFADVVVDTFRNLTVTLANSSTSYEDRNTSFAENFGCKPRNEFGWQPLAFDSDADFLRSQTVEPISRIRILRFHTKEMLNLETEPIGPDPSSWFHNFESCCGAWSGNRCGGTGMRSSHGFMN